MGVSDLSTVTLESLSTSASSGDAASPPVAASIVEDNPIALTNCARPGKALWPAEAEDTSASNTLSEYLRPRKVRYSRTRLRRSLPSLEPRRSERAPAAEPVGCEKNAERH